MGCPSEAKTVLLYALFELEIFHCGFNHRGIINITSFIGIRVNVENIYKILNYRPMDLFHW